MAYDLVVRGAAAMLPGSGQTVCDIAVAGGKIAAMLGPGRGLRRRARSTRAGW